MKHFVKLGNLFNDYDIDCADCIAIDGLSVSGSVTPPQDITDFIDLMRSLEDQLIAGARSHDIRWVTLQGLVSDYC
jgi:hypothetical protein